jgi:flagellar biosynthesis GTPase FlhF
MSTATRTFRGASLEEVLPRIKAELGPDAVITRRREGLTGGVGGFFQKQFVEVEARPGIARLDVLDDSDAVPEALRGSAVRSPQSAEPEPNVEAQSPVTSHQSPVTNHKSPAIEKILEQAAPFADQLSTALERTAPVPGTAMEPLVAGRRAPAEASELVDDLVAAGLHPVLAQGIVTETVSHVLPFSPHSSLDRLVRDTLARRIPVQSTWSRRGRTVGFVGPGGAGKTLCTARLAATYAQGSDLPVICMTLRPRDGGAELAGLLQPYGVQVHPVEDAGEARARIAGAREHALIVIDTPTVSPASPDEMERLAADLERIGVYEVHFTLPATAGEHAAEDMLRAFAPTGVSRIVLTHADETGHVGPAVGLVIRSGRPFSYISSGTSVDGGLMPVNPNALASMIVA